MSLKYRLIILTTVIFAATFGLGVVLSVRGARHLAEVQLRLRLARSASALASSGAPLSEVVLSRFAPVLDSQIMVLDRQGRLQAHSGASWPWEQLRGYFASGAAGGGGPAPMVNGQRYYFGQATGHSPATGEPVSVILLAEEQAVRQPAQSILHLFLVILCATAAVLWGGMYLVGWALVRRVNRLSRRVDETLSEEPARARRAGDELGRLEGAFDDLLERLNRSRQRLAAQQRLATAGKIASSVAHEVRNPLQAIRLTVQMLREKCPPQGQEGCDLILGEIDRLNLLADELLVLAGKDSLHLEAVDLGRELRETLRLLQFQLRQREVRTEAALPPLPAVLMDRNRCRQLLLNLLLNAAEASPRGGVVRVDGEVRTGLAVIRIADNGPGFPPPVLDGQAEEFFSTKATGGGLGLSICRRILAEAAGSLNLYNAQPGAVAEVILPAAAPVANV